jgi:hypothetical protein
MRSDTAGTEKLHALIDHLCHALGDLRHQGLDFQSYLLEMLILSLQEAAMLPPTPAEAA